MNKEKLIKISLTFYFCILFLCISFYNNAECSASELTKKSIISYYQSIESIKVKFKQIKKSKLFIRPVKSIIHMNYRPNYIEWRQSGSKQPGLIIKDKKIKVLDQKTGEYISLPQMSNTTTDNIIQFILSIMGGKLEVIEKNFHVNLKNNILSAIPKENPDRSPMKYFKIYFDNSYKFNKIEFQTKNEEITLKVLDIQLNKLK
ncbi:MAG: hypothetical protein GY714_19095 [Desulfobacterales bacterium]|nr:hypothetical protein [Desulfobacterales bacterium]MCP4159300.1 hypothetical protein [Deltaproteobacteria bacterium]